MYTNCMCMYTSGAKCCLVIYWLHIEPCMVKCLSSCKEMMCSGVILLIGIMIYSYEITLRFSSVYVCIYVCTYYTPHPLRVLPSWTHPLRVWPLWTCGLAMYVLYCNVYMVTPPPTPVHGDPAPCTCTWRPHSPHSLLIHHDYPSALSLQKDHRQAHMYTPFWSGDH